MTPAEFDSHLYHYSALDVEVIDGDTFVADVDLGFGVHRHVHVRILGYDAPELHGATAGPGHAAKEHLWLLIHDEPLRLVTEKDRQSFERYLARVYVELDGSLRDVADLMLAAGHGVPR